MNKEIQPVNPKGNQSWIFIGRTDAEAKTPILWSPGAKNWLTGKDPDAGKDWRQEEKGTTEYEIVEWHHWGDGHEFELVMHREAWSAAVPGVKKSQTWLDWTELRWMNGDIQTQFEILTIKKLSSITIKKEKENKNNEKIIGKRRHLLWRSWKPLRPFSRDRNCYRSKVDWQPHLWIPSGFSTTFFQVGPSFPLLFPAKSWT